MDIIKGNCLSIDRIIKARDYMDNKGYIKKFNKSYEIKISSNRKFLARTSGASVYVHNTVNFEQIAIFKDIRCANQSMFSYDDKLLAVKSAERKIVVYDLESLKKYMLEKLVNHRMEVFVSRRTINTYIIQFIRLNPS